MHGLPRHPNRSAPRSPEPRLLRRIGVTLPSRIRQVVGSFGRDRSCGSCGETGDAACQVRWAMTRVKPR
jgi:hypothetical protein